MWNRIAPSFSIWFGVFFRMCHVDFICHESPYHQYRQSHCVQINSTLCGQFYLHGFVFFNVPFFIVSFFFSFATLFSLSLCCVFVLLVCKRLNVNLAVTQLLISFTYSSTEKTTKIAPKKNCQQFCCWHDALAHAFAKANAKAKAKANKTFVQTIQCLLSVCLINAADGGREPEK